MKISHIPFFLLIFAGGFFVLASCKSAPPVIPDDLSALQFFQRAQEETDNNNWDNALIYYKTFLERYPDDKPNVISAQYEIAFINYKKGDYAESQKGFQEILDFYENSPPALDFPLWPKILSQKLIETVKEKILPLTAAE
jgi:outer membrane protein assembly factor BamD (BamD/ComL family)